MWEGEAVEVMVSYFKDCVLVSQILSHEKNFVGEFHDQLMLT